MRRSLPLFALAVLGACTNEIDQSTRPENIVGSYQLVSYGGAALPAIITADSGIVTVVSGNLILTAERGWSETVGVTATIRGVTSSAPVVSSGTWSQVRPLAYLAFSDTVNGYRFSGMAAGGSIILETVSGRQLIYRR